MTSPPTRERLLDAAERCFAAKGLQATSLREITREAGANLAAVHYHFGSKDDLALEVFRRRLGPVNVRRLELLDAAEKTAGAPGLRCVLEAFLRPAIDFIAEHGLEQARLLGRLHYESDPELSARLIGEFQEVIQRFLTALQRCLPALPPAEILLRGYFMVGSLIYPVMHRDEILRLDPAGVCLQDPGRFLASLLAFVEAGFRSNPTWHEA